MSDVIKLSRVLPSAIKFNAKLQLQIPEAVLQLYPKLRAAYGTAEFAHAVADVQAQLGLEQDGFFGPATQQALTQSVMPDADFLVIKGQRVAINTAGLFTITDFTENPRYDLHKYGNFSGRKKPVARVVVHHGGFNVDHLASVLSTSERKVSTHIGLDISHDGKVRVAQYLDLAHLAWHAGKMNEGSIGIDFAMQPSIEHQQRYGFKVVQNPSSIGPRQILEFPDATIEAMAQLIAELHRVFNMGAIRPAETADERHEDTALLSSHSGLTVVGHHHFATNGKFDCSYLWHRLVPALRAI
jgi:hypothetical protein